MPFHVQKSIKDHFLSPKKQQPCQHQEHPQPQKPQQDETTLYPLFRSKKTISKNTDAPTLPHTHRRKGTAMMTINPNTNSSSVTLPESALHKPVTETTTTTTIKAEKPKPLQKKKERIPRHDPFKAIITQDTHQFYSSQKTQRMKLPRDNNNSKQPVRCSGSLDIDSIKARMNAHYKDEWTHDPRCKHLLDRLPTLNNDPKTLWRDKYRPTAVDGLLGASSDHKYLRHWLNQLKIKRTMLLASTQTRKVDPIIDSAELCNVMLLEGGHGLGKTATVYTVAKELDYTVFEINSSSRRAGKDITESVGEMTESHLVRFDAQKNNKRKVKGETLILRDTVKKKAKTVDIAQHFKRMLTMQTQQEVEAQVKEEHEEEEEEEKEEAPTCQQKQEDHTLKAFFQKAQEKHEQQLASQPKQSLILLEEVDVLFEEDKGFWPAVIDICQKSKRPVIMTCNDKSKIPLDSLHIQSTIYFDCAANKSLVPYLELMCYWEGYVVDPVDIQYVCELFQFDARRIIDTLQFWLNERPQQNQYFVYSHLFAHIMGFSDLIATHMLPHLMDRLSGESGRVVNLCQRYFFQYQSSECSTASSRDIDQIMEVASFADAWIEPTNRQRHQLYDIDQYYPQDTISGSQVLYKNAADLDHWELGEVIANSISAMNLESTSECWRNHVSAWSSHWEKLCYSRKLYYKQCLDAYPSANQDTLMMDYMPFARFMSNSSTTPIKNKPPPTPCLSSILP